jgi:hypothetical protein
MQNPLHQSRSSGRITRSHSSNTKQEQPEQRGTNSKSNTKNTSSTLKTTKEMEQQQQPKTSVGINVLTVHIQQQTTTQAERNKRKQHRI